MSTQVIEALTLVCAIFTLGITAFVAWTARTIHKVVNSNHQQDVDRIDQLTGVIVDATGVELPPRPSES